MKRLLSFLTALVLGIVGFSYFNDISVHAMDSVVAQMEEDSDEISTLLDEVPDDVSIDVQLEQIEDDILDEDEAQSVIPDLDDTLEGFLTESGAVDDDSVDMLIDSIEEQVEMILNSSTSDVENQLKNGVLQRLFASQEFLQGQRSYLTDEQKDKLRDFAKQRRRLAAVFMELKEKLKELKKESNSSIRQVKGGIRTILRQGAKLTTEQRREALKRIKSQAEEAVKERKEKARMFLEKRVNDLKEECLDDTESCKRRLKKVREKKTDEWKESVERLENICKMADDPEACQERVEAKKEKQAKRVEELKERAKILKDACMSDGNSDVCQNARQNLKDLLERQKMEREESSDDEEIFPLRRRRLFN